MLGLPPRLFSSLTCRGVDVAYMGMHVLFMAAYGFGGGYGGGLDV